jgi:hypothetical protein
MIAELALLRRENNCLKKTIDDLHVRCNYYNSYIKANIAAEAPSLAIHNCPKSYKEAPATSLYSIGVKIANRIKQLHHETTPKQPVQEEVILGEQMTLASQTPHTSQPLPRTQQGPQQKMQSTQQPPNEDSQPWQQQKAQPIAANPN